MMLRLKPFSSWKLGLTFMAVSEAFLPQPGSRPGWSLIALISREATSLTIQIQTISL